MGIGCSRAFAHASCNLCMSEVVCVPLARDGMHHRFDPPLILLKVPLASPQSQLPTIPGLPPLAISKLQLTRQQHM